jgi:hypothetical protein
LITNEEIKHFDIDGAVTIDSPLTADDISIVSAAISDHLPLQDPTEGESPRYRYGASSDFFAQPLLDLIQHPFFEEVSKRVLRTDEVKLFQSAMACTYPQPGTEFSFDQHTDIQYCTSDLEAVPRRMLCSYFLWISDTNDRRAPLMFRPGSHLLIAAEREKNSSTRGVVPTVQGVKMSDLPSLPYADPIPIVATAGQVSVLTTSTVHGASVNLDSEPRKAFIITFHAKEVEIRLPANQAEMKLRYDRELKKRLRPERLHIVSA